MSDTTSAGIESVLNETRLFSPPAEFSSAGPNAKAIVPHITSLEQYKELHARSIDDPEGFWGEAASELHWFEPWSRVLDWQAPDAKWFVGAKTNLSYNCLDRQIEAGLGDEVALIWEGEPIDDEPEVRTFTYRELRSEVCRCANALRTLGVSKGDIVTLYLPMIPELAIAMLACARLGAPHSIIFGGFSATAIADRVHDAKSKVIITADGGWRRGKIVPLKDNVDQACKQVDTIEHVIVVEHGANPIDWHEKPSAEHGGKRDHWWHNLTIAADESCPCEEMDAEDLLFVLYTSGTTGKPKGIMHTTGGYMVYAYLTSKYVFDLHHGANQVFWCTADIGWVTGHSYIIYGILPNRVPTLMYEGAPNHPAPDRFWDIVERHNVTHFYTAPTAIRAFMKWGDEHPTAHDLSSLRVLGTVGEPINPEAWMWYRHTIGKEQCPIVDTWWQTETGGHMITPLPGAIPTKPGSCALPFFGVDAAIVDATGVEQPDNAGGLLAIRKPWPGMLRGILGDRDRYIQTYWSNLKNSDGEPIYFAGDGARRDTDGFFWIMGRVDDVINVAGHRLGTMEIESALVSHPSVVEAAVVGMPDELKGTAIAAFVTLGPGSTPDDKLKVALREHVRREIGAIAKPSMIRFTDALPKTRSGKIMRRLLRDIAAGVEEVGDTTTLEDYAVLAKLREAEES